MSLLRREALGRVWRLASTRRAWLDVAVATALAAVGVIEQQRVDARVDALAYLAVLLMTVPLALRSVFPIPIALLAAGAIVVRAAPPSEVHVMIPVLVLTAFTLGVDVEERRSLATAAATMFLLVVAILRDPTVELVPSVATAAGLVVGPYGVGRALRGRQLRVTLLETERERRAHEAVEAERLRIARELHDIVAHSVSVMVVQAAAGEQLISRDPARAVGSLRAIQRTGREALRDMRRLVEMLRVPGEATPDRPGLAQLDELAARMDRAGLAVRLEIRGDPIDLPPAIDLSAYRIVQEAVTNVLKHAAAAQVHVRISYAAGAIDLEVEDDGHGQAGADAGAGRGLAGMRERVALYGGILDVGHSDKGGYRVHARLPVPSAAS